MLFSQKIKRIADGGVGRAQHFVAVLDQAAVEVLVDHLDDVERDLAAFAQLLQPSTAIRMFSLTLRWPWRSNSRP